MGQCHWPGCVKDVPTERAFCYRHFSRLPGKTKGWIAATYRGPGSDMKPVWAAIAFAKKNPDPELPPFANGEVIRGKAGGLFAETEYTVDTCLLTDQKTWVVVTSEGETFAASEMRPAA